MATYAKQLEQVLDLMLKADARKLQIKEGKLSIDPKEDKLLRKYTAEARELTKSILVSMSREILSEQDLAALNDASDELETGDITADTGDEASDRIENEERGFTDSGSDVDDVGADAMDGADATGAESDDVGELVDKLMSLVGPDEAIDLISDAGGEGGDADELDEFANIDDAASVEPGGGADEDVNLDELLAGLGSGDDEGGEGEAFGDDEDTFGEEGSDEGAEEDDGEEGESEDDFGGDAEEEDDAEGDAEGEDEEEKEEPVTESLRSRTRVSRRGK